jgi:predicted nucleic acid-binding protein
MLVVADTSLINYLVLLEHTALLPRLYTRVALPPAVIRELLDAEAPEAVHSWAADLPPWCEMRYPAFLSGRDALG